MEAKYCIFDMDGTLVDSMGEWDKLQHEILAAKGVEAGRAEAIVEAYHLTLYDSAVFFIERFGLPDDPAALEKEMNDAMERRYRTTVPANMVSLTIKADQDYIVKNENVQFQEFTKQLIKKTTPPKTVHKGAFFRQSKCTVNFQAWQRV